MRKWMIQVGDRSVVVEGYNLKEATDNAIFNGNNLVRKGLMTENGEIPEGVSIIPICNNTMADDVNSVFQHHPGGGWYAWKRQLSRNTYTIDPSEPEKDAWDKEKDALFIVAELLRKYAKRGKPL